MIRYSVDPFLMSDPFITFSTMLYIDLLVQYIEGFSVVGVNHTVKQLPAWSSLLSPSLPIIEPVMRERDRATACQKDRDKQKGAFLFAEFVPFSSLLELHWSPCFHLCDPSSRQDLFSLRSFQLTTNPGRLSYPFVLLSDPVYCFPISAFLMLLLSFRALQSKLLTMLFISSVC